MTSGIRVSSFLLLPLVLLACGESGPAHPALDLPRVGTIGGGPYTSERPTLVVNLFAEGRISVEGTDLDIPGLRERLRVHADLRRDEGSPRRWSEVEVVFRCDRDVPWRNTQWALQAAPESRITRLYFAVLPEEGTEEGSLAIFLPRDEGLAGMRVRVAPVPAAAVRVARGLGPPAEPADLHATFEKLYPGRSTGHAVLWADGDVPTGYVIETLDHLLRRGITDIRLRGAPLPDPGGGLHAARESRGARGAGILIDGRPVATGDSVRTPAPEGVVSTGPVGVLSRDVAVELTTDWGHGGRAEDDELIDTVLAWLASRQHAEGYWTNREGDPSTVATGLVLLAYLAAGQNHRTTPHRRTVKNGLKFLKRNQAEDGGIRHPDRDDAPEDEAVAALAMIETYRSTLSPLFRQSSQAAAVRLAPDEDPGVWTMLAVVTAREADLLAEDAGGRRMRERLDHPIALAVDELPDWSAVGADPESWFLTARRLAREGGARWKTWSTALRAAVLAGRRDDGAWEAAGRQGRAGTTALALLCLADWAEED